MKKQVLLLALGVVASAPVARADMRWKTEMKIEGVNAPRAGRPGGMAPLIFTTMAVKDGAPAQRKHGSSRNVQREQCNAEIMRQKTACAS